MFDENFDASAAAGDCSGDVVPCIGDALSLAGLDLDTSPCWVSLPVSVTGFRCLLASASQTSYVSEPKRTKCTSFRSPEHS